MVYRLAWLGLLAGILVSVVSASAAANSVPLTGIWDAQRTITANDLKPTECATVNVTAVYNADGNFSGYATNDLIFGGTGIDTIRGGDGDDCIVGGPGDDLIFGDAGSDVCVGGPGIDVFDLLSCEVALQ